VVTVRFFLEAPGATTVMVSGNFNQWSSMDIPLKPEGDGKTWSATVRLKRSREYRYNFVIDNQIWIADPHAAVSIDDDFGGKVSLLDL
jgi:1,4-alpha-glucan branching enzyme